MGRSALICGISGQDGAYLARLLLEKGYRVFGTSRDARTARFQNLEKLGIRQDVGLLSMSFCDYRSVFQTISGVKPDEIYNLAGQSSVGISFEKPVETYESISGGTLYLLESLRLLGEPVRFFNAGSGECFGDTGGTPAEEKTPFRPRSPYAVAKAAAFWQVAAYRDAYGLFACTGILFNHESPLRPAHFVTRKVISAACRIAAGSGEKLSLGDISIARDWGWAPEYVEAMWRTLQQDSPEDFIIATGRAHTLQELVERTFSFFGLDWRNHVVSDPSLLRKSEIAMSGGNPARAGRLLGWKARSGLDDIIRMMVEAEKGLTEVGRTDGE